MSRPSLNLPALQSAQQGWDATVSSNQAAVQGLVNDAPWPIHAHVGDETDLAATFPPGQYDRCLVWVNHSARGWELWWSDGAAWKPLSRVYRGTSAPPAADFMLWVDTSTGPPALKVSDGVAWH
ncbi:MAG: hypothetical protein AB7I33_08760 [Gemmatimonadales bacterium]